jgi:hypothetical protein
MSSVVKRMQPDETFWPKIHGSLVPWIPYNMVPKARCSETGGMISADFGRGCRLPVAKLSVTYNRYN